MTGFPLSVVSDGYLCGDTLAIAVNGYLCGAGAVVETGYSGGAQGIAFDLYQEPVHDVQARYERFRDKAEEIRAQLRELIDDATEDGADTVSVRDIPAFTAPKLADVAVQETGQDVGGFGVLSNFTPPWQPHLLFVEAKVAEARAKSEIDVSEIQIILERLETALFELQDEEDAIIALMLA